MITRDIVRPSKQLIKALSDHVSSATAAGELSRLGIRDPFMKGPVTFTPGVKVVGPAVTLLFMPKREDVYGEQEYTDPEKQLHRHVLYQAGSGDIVVVDARADMSSGCFGNMMLTYFKGKGGLGVVIDGCIRDYAIAKTLGLGLWLRGVTPNYHTQTNIFPMAVNVPIACGGVLVFPGDIIIADDDGAVVVPAKLAPELVKRASAHADWEDFSREKLEQGGDLRRYYPLTEDAFQEYLEWRKAHGLPPATPDEHMLERWKKQKAKK
ncbi:MAG: ribonuclease activity regulator RraA [Chloroflexota bacterium]|nr:ribonuclease activity regulator RraA [Chloroflexota bacterium]